MCIEICDITIMVITNNIALRKILSTRVVFTKVQIVSLNIYDKI